MNKYKKIFLIIVGVVAIIIIASAVSANRNKKHAPINKSQPWYAVHLANGQVYFGHLAAVAPDTITLADTYYMEVYTAPATGQTSSSTNFQLQTATAPQQIYNLTRRGVSDNMQTDNTLFIDRRSALFWEKLNADSEMAKWLGKAEQK